MTATKFAAIYSTNNKHLRRMVVFTEEWRHDGEFSEQGWCGPGESMVLVDMKHYDPNDLCACHAAIGQAIFDKHGEHAVLPGDPRLYMQLRNEKGMT